jgi:hypothetical protein
MRDQGPNRHSYLSPLARFTSSPRIAPAAFGSAPTVDGYPSAAATRQAEVVDELFAGEEVSREADVFDVELPKRSTSLYYTGARALLGKLPR